MRKYFNTAGVCIPGWHYMLPPVPRLPEARQLVERGQYFVVHAPRQTGKTTTLVALANALTSEGRYAAVYITCEAGRAIGEDYVAVQRLILAELRARARSDLPAELRPPPWPNVAEEEGRLLGAGGYITREYGTGWKRVDICVRWPYTDHAGRRAEQREAVELKVWRRGRDPLGDGLVQLDQYLDRMGIDRGTLVVFDRRRDAPPPYERTRFNTDRTPSGRHVTLLRA